jgi:Raf kinase inhibitor-like YbhB/YbcL family protein
MTRLSLLLSLLAFATSCATQSNLPDLAPGATLESITVTSRSFASGEAIPIDCTCDGKNTAPDVTWSSPPEGTQALVVMFDDQEPQQGTGSRWLVVNVSPDARSIRAGGDVTKVGGMLGLNDDGEPGYGGPCPPRHQRHHMVLRVVALDHPLKMGEPRDRATILARMNGHVLGAGELTGVVGR